MTKKKKKQTAPPSEPEHLLTADDPSARDAALTEDAARSGDSEALRAGSKDGAFDDTFDGSEEAEAISEESEQEKPPTPRQQRKADIKLFL